LDGGDEAPHGQQGELAVEGEAGELGVAVMGEQGFVVRVAEEAVVGAGAGLAAAVLLVAGIRRRRSVASSIQTIGSPKVALRPGSVRRRAVAAATSTSQSSLPLSRRRARARWRPSRDHS
jgi:hypothetical protein